MKKLLLILGISPFLFSVAQAADWQSQYSELSSKKCKTLQGNEESESREQICAGIAGYGLKILEGDLRESVTVVDPKGKEHPLDYWTVVTGGFSSLGAKAEWRVGMQDGKAVPKALIVRVDASENSEQPDKKTSYLAVAKITPGKICVTARIPPSPEQNTQARLAADASGDKPCLDAINK